jgi:hypothetical protein
LFWQQEVAGKLAVSPHRKKGFAALGIWVPLLGGFIVVLDHLGIWVPLWGGFIMVLDNLGLSPYVLTRDPGSASSLAIWLSALFFRCRHTLRNILTAYSNC